MALQSISQEYSRVEARAQGRCAHLPPWNEPHAPHELLTGRLAQLFKPDWKGHMPFLATTLDNIHPPLHTITFPHQRPHKRVRFSAGGKRKRSRV